MDCPQCSSSFTRPIYQCISGHSICHECRLNCEECPLCYRTYKGTRNFALEEVLETMRYPCANAVAGCVYNLHRTELTAHQTTCPYRKYRCFVKTCRWKGRRCNMYNHFKAEHSQSLQESNSETYSDDKFEKMRHHIYIYTYEEFFIVKVVPRQGIIYWITYYVGCSEKASQFLYEVEIKTICNPIMCFKASSICAPDVVTYDDVIESGYFVAMHAKNQEIFLNNDNRLSWTITIHRR